MDDTTRQRLATHIAGEVTMSDEPGATLRKWREEFDVTGSTLADELDVSPSVVSDYESGRRDSPGVGIVRRFVDGLLDIDAARGGDRLRQFARVLSAGFDSDIVHDLREYPTTVPLRRFYSAIGATEVVGGSDHTVAGHTVINSIAAISRLSSEEFYRLYGQSTNRALVFSDVTRGEGPLVAQRVVTPTPTAVVLHGLSEEELWEHAPALAKTDGYSLAVTDEPLDDVLDTLRGLP
ncbi:helix-turn-helix domain-containing protein [Halosegnis rubeus]|jgi:putative transcriptional regulator|uniref:Helix-turn-helix domain-containing protein n=1 Tax=Halosegnis rubeus TaxID=2212850 RepID=A0A5N5UEZ5_9EURY|nr:helix-turn-helix domain-containing protein [Halosegnis rubeus]KAB7513293.1 helix-turn-helix domain-containing protein [Halosegnis rubeus]KAB7517276.1 helix-turn-helix domain-containing protein [Halosegnis rubeus]KAB7518492.1 helix-turn-helix domain-containing protein [Halosegnis rubeus]